MFALHRYQQIKTPTVVVLILFGTLLGLLSYFSEQERYHVKDGENGIYIAGTVTNSIMIMPEISELIELDGFLTGHTNPTQDKSLSKEDVDHLEDMYPSGYFIVAKDSSIFMTGLTKVEFLKEKNTLGINK